MVEVFLQSSWMAPQSSQALVEPQKEWVLSAVLLLLLHQRLQQSLLQLSVSLLHSHPLGLVPHATL